MYYVLFYYTNRCAFFLGEIDKPAHGILQRGKRKAVSVGICLEGVYVLDVKEKVRQLCQTTTQFRVSHFVWVRTWIISSFHFSYSDFLAACTAWPAFQSAFLGPQLP